MALLRVLVLASALWAGPVQAPVEQLSGIQATGHAAVGAGEAGYRLAGEGFESPLTHSRPPVSGTGAWGPRPGLGTRSAFQAEAPRAEPPAGAVYAAEAGGAGGYAMGGGLKAAVGGNPAVGAAALGLGLAVVGFMLGGPIGAVVGFLIGALLGAGLTHCP